MCSFSVYPYGMTTPPLAFLPFLSLIYPIPLLSFLGLKAIWRKKVNKPKRTKYDSGNITWFLAETCRHHCGKEMLIDVKLCWGSAVCSGFAWVELSSISPLQPPCHPPSVGCCATHLASHIHSNTVASSLLLALILWWKYSKTSVSETFSLLSSWLKLFNRFKMCLGENSKLTDGQAMQPHMPHFLEKQVKNASL